MMQVLIRNCHSTHADAFTCIGDTGLRGPIGQAGEPGAKGAKGNEGNYQVLDFPYSNGQNLQNGVHSEY